LPAVALRDISAVFVVGATAMVNVGDEFVIVVELVDVGTNVIVFASRVIVIVPDNVAKPILQGFIDELEIKGQVNILFPAIVNA